MSNKDVIDDLKKAEINGENVELDKYGSWALYDKDVIDKANKHLDIKPSEIGFPKISDDELRKRINPQYMLVSLNTSKDVNNKDASWQNFHFTERTSNDANILKILTGTDFFGAYMTDLIKDFVEGSSDVVLKELTGLDRTDDNKENLRSSLKKFQIELNCIKPKRIIIFGGVAFKIFKMAVQEGALSFTWDDDIQVAKTPHYSYRFKDYASDISLYSRFTKNDYDVMKKKDYGWKLISDLQKKPNRNRKYKIALKDDESK